MSEFLMRVARGQVIKHSVVNKFGENPASAADTVEDVWDGGGDYPYPATALMVKVAGAVDQATMRGEVIEVCGLDADWKFVRQNVTLDASDTTTAVTMTTPLIRCFRMKVMADVVTDQDISVTNAAGDVKYATITAGNNQTLMAIYTVPANHTAYVVQYYASIALALNKEPSACNARLWAADRKNGYEFQLKHSLTAQKNGANINHEFKPYMKLDQKTDIKITGLAYAEEGRISAGFDLIVVDDTVGPVCT